MRAVTAGQMAKSPVTGGGPEVLSLVEELMHPNGIGFHPMSQPLALLSLVFMMSYVFVFDKLRWQIRHPDHGAVPSSPRPISWGMGASGHPFRK